MLLVFEQKDPALPALSDSICTALQLANHWQDAAIDYARGRIYVPEDLMRRHGVSTWDFSTARVSDGWRGMMAELIARTRALFEAGRPLCDRVGRELRFEMRLTWLGGTTILDRIERADYDMVHARPRLRAADFPTLAWRALRWESR